LTVRLPLQKIVGSSAAAPSRRSFDRLSTSVRGCSACVRVRREASGSEGLIVLVNPIYFLQRKQIIDRAADYRLPAIYEWKAFAQSGGLISYGAVSTDVYRRAASYADKIIKGAKPGDLPAEGPKKTELVGNLKTAKALGLTIPPALLARADEVIE
jgi:putative ABC transport system substrate-binding protein